VIPPFNDAIDAPLLLLINENATAAPLTAVPSLSVTVAVKMLDSPAASDSTLADTETLPSPPDVVPSSKEPPQAIINASIAKEISSNNNLREDFALDELIILFSFLIIEIDGF
jgi:hypothetical protein